MRLTRGLMHHESDVRRMQHAIHCKLPMIDKNMWIVSPAPPHVVWLHVVAVFTNRYASKFCACKLFWVKKIVNHLHLVKRVAAGTFNPTCIPIKIC